MTLYRVLIADDHPLARSAVRSLLEDDTSFEIVGETATGEGAVEACAESRPDVVLMDLNMPGIGGLEATRQIRQRFPQVKIVILSVSDAAADLFTAIQFGAQGYLLKGMDPVDWLDYLHALLDENPEQSRRLADKLFYRFRSGQSEEGPNPSILTGREKEIAALVAAGLTNRHIGETLVISENTVKNHIKNILEKLGLDNRVQLAAFAVNNRIAPETDKR